MAVVARCPECRGRFPWDPSLGFPTKCPLPGCDYVAPEKKDDSVVVIAAPFIRSARTKATDDCYRQLEQSSEVRAQMAADAAGVPVSEMSHLKVTNIKDNTRPGEIAAMPVVNEVTKQMDRMKAMGGQVGYAAANGQAYSDAATTGAISVNGQVIRGIEPRAGIKAMERVQGMFNR